MVTLSLESNPLQAIIKYEWPFLYSLRKEPKRITASKIIIEIYIYIIFLTLCSYNIPCGKNNQSYFTLCLDCYTNIVV